jgi:hypothetical protein
MLAYFNNNYYNILKDGVCILNNGVFAQFFHF